MTSSFPLSGIFVGRKSTGEELQWSLTFSPQEIENTPNLISKFRGGNNQHLVLGVVCDQSSADSDIEIAQPSFLKGFYSQHFRTFTIYEDSPTESQICHYIGTIKKEEGMISLSGNFVDAKTGGNGEFEFKISDSAVGGWFTGFATPDNSLVDFMIPTNPIFWGLNFLLDDAAPRVFGSGCFFDAGDVETEPVLFFSLSGVRREGLTLRLVKRYQKVAGMDTDYVVSYDGPASQNEDQTWTIKGSWRNDAGGSFGEFSCRSTAQPVDDEAELTAAMEALCVDGASDFVGEKTTTLVLDNRMMAHEYKDDHPECPARIAAIRRKLLSLPRTVLAKCVVIPARAATPDEILRVHEPSVMTFVESLTSADVRSENKDMLKLRSLYANQHSHAAALLACGGVAEATAAVMQGKTRNALCVVRPPGHHAEPDACMGFCFFNNVAVAVQSARAAGAKKVLIVDWDVHFGNGTSAAFAEDKNVLFFSVHRFHDGYFYPGGDNGGPKNVGKGEGAGYNVNIGWNKVGRGDADYLAAWHQVLLPIAYEFDPDLVFVSAGFDAARGDPLGLCNITPEGYAHLLHPLLAFADGKIVVVLEGGYNLTSISESAAACLSVLTGYLPPRLEPSSLTTGAQDDISMTIQCHKQYWRGLPNIATSPPSANTRSHKGKQQPLPPVEESPAPPAPASLDK